MSAKFEMKLACGPAPLTVAQALQEGAASLSRAGVESARLDAELLLAEALNFERSRLYLDHGMALDPRAGKRFRLLLSRRVGGEPVAYISGRREFWSLDFLVTRAVLVPRPETELLVEVAVGLVEAEFQTAGRRLQMMDLGTGSGAIAVALAREISDVEIWATDVSLEVLQVAQANARRHGVEEKIRFLSADLFEPVRARGFFQMIVSNPPYVRRREFDGLVREVRDFEPRVGLDGGPDGLDFYRRIIPQAQFHLAAGGFIALEIGADMGAEVTRLFADAGGYSHARVYRDYAGRDRVVSARKLA